MRYSMAVSPINRSGKKIYSKHSTSGWKVESRKQTAPPPYRRALIISSVISAITLATTGLYDANAASITYTGELNSQPAPGTEHWIVGGDLIVGDTNPGTLLIDAGATVNNDWAYVGNFAGGPSSVTVQGDDGTGNFSTWTSSGQLLIGVEPNSNGALNILSGGLVVNTQTVTIGSAATSNGTALVSGNGSTWNSSLGSTFIVGSDGNGTLRIEDGGVVNSGQALIGYYSGGNGRVTATGLNSAWNPDNNIYVGFTGIGELEVLEGASVSTMATGGGSATIYLGLDNGSQGSVTVESSTSNISTLSATDDLVVGQQGSGTITINKGGLVRVSWDVEMANDATGSGTLHLNGDATGRGVLETGAVIAGAGSTNLDLNGGILRANKNQSDFLQNFSALTVGTEGAWIDSNSRTIAIHTAFSGTSTFNKLGAGTLRLTGDSSTFSGDAAVHAGTLQMDGTMGGRMDVMAGGRLTGSGQVGSTTNSGVIAPGHSNTLGTLTIAGDYTPSGGMIEIRTVLGDDSSLTDSLVITGSTIGTTPVRVTNAGGLGAQTIEGIKIIDVAGSSAGNFTLLGTTTFEGDPAVVAGAYAYRLYQGGTSTPTDGDWYLRSVLQNAPEGTPLYQPGVPSYEAYPQILLGLNGMPTLQQRVGNRFWNAGGTASKNTEDYVAGSFTESNGMWLRMEGGHNRIDPKSSTVGSTYKYDMVKMQGGLDAVLAEYSSGKLVGGLSAHYVHGKADTSWRYGGVSNYGAGSISTDGYGIGSTLTWYGDYGFYVDGSAQVTWYRSDLSARPGHRLEKNNEAFGYAASVEAGKRMSLNQEWSLTPQAQLTYSKASFDNFTDKFGTSIRSGRDDSLQGRVGVSVERQINRTYIYGIANIYNEFLNGTSILIDHQSFKNRQDQLWAGIGFGWSYNWANDKFSLYGKGVVNTSLADSDSYGYGGTLGFRANW